MTPLLDMARTERDLLANSPQAAPAADPMRAIRKFDDTTSHAPELCLPAPANDPGEIAPELAKNAQDLGALKPVAAARENSQSLYATILASAGHAVLVFALAFAIGSAGQLQPDAETPVEIEIVVEPPAQTAPEIAPEPVIEVEQHPPLPDPVVDLTEPKEVAELPPEPPPALMEPAPAEPAPLEPSPQLALEPPPPAQTAPALVVPRPPPPAQAQPPKVDADRQRRQEIARQRLLDEQRREKREEAREREQERARAAARQQQARAAAQNRAPQVRPGSTGQQGASAAPRGDNSMSINAFKAAIAARIAQNKPASSTAAAAQGTVVVAFSVTASGSAAGIRIASSSGHGVLDQAALAAVRRASPFPAPPPGAPRTFSVPMRFNVR